MEFDNIAHSQGARNTASANKVLSGTMLSNTKTSCTQFLTRLSLNMRDHSIVQAYARLLYETVYMWLTILRRSQSMKP